MPPESFTGGLSTSEWLTILGMVVSFLTTIGVQSFLFIRWLTKQFEKRDEERAEEIEERNKALDGVKSLVSQYADSARTAIARYAEQSRAEIARIDKDIAQLRENVNVKLATLPTRESMETMLANRVGPMEQELRALTIELARNGLHNPASRVTQT